MERQYVPLRSAPPNQNRAQDWSQLDVSEAPGLKKRRIGVSVACNACRRRKVRCDGQRPVCTNCQGQTGECVYRDEADLSNESRSLVIEIVRMLNSVSSPDAVRILKLVCNETNAAIVLSTLRDETRGSSQTTEDAAAGLDSEVNPEPLEFVVQNPIAYPIITPFDRNLLEKELDLGQPGSRKGDWSSGSNSGSRSGSSSGQRKESPSSSSTKGSQAVSQGVSSQSPSPFPRAHTKSLGRRHPPRLCDPRLRDLNIGYWTNINLDNDTAARCISLYLETDHPLLGHFDPEAFVSDLVSKRTEHCSSLLVNALLYWACQMYSSIDPQTDAIALSFCTEAERLWNIERDNKRDSVLNIAATEFLCLGYLGQGRDHVILKYVTEASEMGVRMGLFGVPDQNDGAGEAVGKPVQATDQETKGRMYAAWGVFNWITLMSLFYRQPGLNSPRYPPRLPIPEYRNLAESAGSPNSKNSPSLAYMGQTFSQICRFWYISHEVSLVYCDDRQSWGSSASLPFAEYKFRELLAWSNNLPSRLSQGPENPPHVHILHMWFHAAILDIFRPHAAGETGGSRHLRTFSDRSITPDSVCAASVAQLQHLITEYRLNYQSSAYTMLWHTALIYVINAILNSAKEGNWYSDLLVCIYAYESLGRSWRVSDSIAKGLLTLAMQKSDIPSLTARRILRDIENDPDRIPQPIRATFMGDLNLALSDPGRASMEHLATIFEDSVALKDYTTIFDDSTMS